MQSPATPHRRHERVPPSAPQRPSRPSPSPFLDQPPRIAPWYEASRQLQVVTGLKGCNTDEQDCTLPPLRSLGLDDPFGLPTQPPSLAGRLGLAAEHTRSHAHLRQNFDARSSGSSSASETDASSVYPDADGQLDALQALAASARFFQAPTHAPATSVASSMSPRPKTQGSLSLTDEFDDHSGRFLSPLVNLKLDDEGVSPHYRHRRTPSSPAALQPNFAQSTQTLPPIGSVDMVRSRSNSGAARHPCCGEPVQWRRRNAYVLVPISAFTADRQLAQVGAARNERQQRHASPLQHVHAPYVQARAALHHSYAPISRSASPLQRSVSPCQPQHLNNVSAKRNFA